jgi:hypothetical protein
MHMYQYIHAYVSYPCFSRKKKDLAHTGTLHSVDHVCVCVCMCMGVCVISYGFRMHIRTIMHVCMYEWIHVSICTCICQYMYVSLLF